MLEREPWYTRFDSATNGVLEVSMVGLASCEGGLMTLHPGSQSR